MPIKRIDELTNGSSTLSGDDLVLILDDPNNASITKYASVSSLINIETKTYGTITSGVDSIISGGISNTVNGSYDTISGGKSNIINGSYSNIGGGYSNTLNGSQSSINGGVWNSIQNSYSIIGGGGYNTNNAYASLVAGGTYNTIQNGASNSIITGGNNNVIYTGSYTSNINGGLFNNINGFYSTIGGGEHNTNSGNYGTVNGGRYNTVSSYIGAVGGGAINTNSAYGGLIAGGYTNTIDNYATYGVISGGAYNTLDGKYSNILGGKNNSTSGYYATVLGGQQTIAYRYGQVSHSAGSFDSNPGSAQHTILIGRIITNDDNLTEITLNGITEHLYINDNQILSGTINIVGSKNNGSSVARYMRQFTVKNVNGTLSIVGSITTIGADEVSGTSIDIDINNVSNFLVIKVAGVYNETWRWVCTVDCIEMKFN